jgi:exopolysaccharide production protein ExoZ
MSIARRVKNQQAARVEPRAEIYGIQILRGIAAVLVVIVHSDHMLRQDKYFGVSYIGDFANGGNLGVDLFFVISGFIMYYITRGFAVGADSKKFVRRRFVRIIPFMWLCILSAFALRSAVRGHQDPIPFVRAIFLWPVGDVEPNPVWTLRHELFLYVCTFCCLHFRRGYLLLWAFFIIPIPLAWLMSRLDSFDSELLSTIFRVRANTSFCMGVIVGWLFQTKSLRLRPAIGTWTVVLSPFLLLCSDYYVFSGIHSSIPRCICISLACAVIVFASLGYTPSSSLSTRLGLTLGNASYSIYLTHEIIISFTGVFCARMDWLSHPGAAGIFAVAASCIAGTYVHFLIEKPLVKYLRRRMGDIEPALSESIAGSTRS